MIFDEISTCFNEIMETGRTGVILELCGACSRLKSKQSVFMQLWMQHLQCDTPKEAQNFVSPLTIYLKRKNEYSNTEERNVQLHGSLMLQHMLKFNKPIKVISSLLDMNTEELCNVFSSPKGSHIVNAFFESEFVGEKSKEKLTKTLQGQYSNLSISKHGSRVFDLIWRWANVKNKIFIASELLEEEAKLNGSQFGRPIIYNVALGTFRRKKEEWIKAQTDGNKVQKLFADLVE